VDAGFDDGLREREGTQVAYVLDVGIEEVAHVGFVGFDLEFFA
jgi:hypothetical protein